MKVIAVIPARYEASRFPGKLMEDLGGKPVLMQTYTATLNTALFDEVLVATDSDIIFEYLKKENVPVFKSIKTHESGSDRIAEAIAETDADVIVNVQGDEPFLDKEILRALIRIFEEDTHQSVDVASLMFQIKEEEAIHNPNNVKVVVDIFQNALYFSRSVLPYGREILKETQYFQHIGVYAFRKQALQDFTQWEASVLEKTEKLEQLRYLEQGKKIRMICTAHQSIGIDTPQDLEKARKLWNGNV